MKDFLNKFFSGQQATDTEITEFLYKFAKKKGRELSAKELVTLNTAIKFGIINIVSIAKEAAGLEKLDLYTIYSPTGVIISYKLVDHAKENKE